MTTKTNIEAVALSDEQIRDIENDQAKMPGATRENLTVRTVRAALIAQHGFCRDEDHCTCAREIGYRVCQPNSTASPKAVNSGQTERESFEAWAATEYGNDDDDSGVDLTRQSDGYLYSGIDDAWNGWQARAMLASKPADPTRSCVCGEPTTANTIHRQDGPCYIAPAAEAVTDEASDLAFSVYSGLNALRWLLNLTTEFDRKDVRTRQAARLLDDYTDSFGKTNRQRLEDLWKKLYDKLPDDGRVNEYLRTHDAASRELAARAKEPK